MSRITAQRWICLAAGLAAIFASSEVLAAEPLRWKFEPGMSNRYRMTQSMKMGMTVGENAINNDVDQIIDMSWTVKEVKNDGSAVLDQKIDHMRMTINAGGTKTEIDSASTEEPQGLAAMLAPMLKAFTAEPFRVTMSPRGEIIDVVAPEKMLEALKNSPGAAMMGDLATPAGFKKMVSSAAFTLPEKLEPNTEWTQKMEMNLPQVGKQISETTYRYDGPKEVDGKQFEAFTPSLKMRYEGGEAAVEIVEQDSKGEMLFNREAGRLESSQLEQNMKLKIKSGPQSIDQTLKQKVEMKWLPKDAE